MEVEITPRSKSFQFKKLCLITLAILSLGIIIFMMVNLLKIACPNSICFQTKDIIYFFISVFLILPGVFQLVVIYVILKDNYCMVMTYSIFMGMTSVISITIAVYRSFYWVFVIIFFMVSIFGLSLSKDMNSAQAQIARSLQDQNEPIYEEIQFPTDPNTSTDQINQSETSQLWTPQNNDHAIFYSEQEMPSVPSESFQAQIKNQQDETSFNEIETCQRDTFVKFSTFFGGSS